MSARRISDEQWAQARAMRSAGQTLSAIGVFLGVTRQAVHANVYGVPKSRVSWKPPAKPILDLETMDFASALLLQQRAISRVGQAVFRGDIPKPSELKCTDCGGSATSYDHRDYRRPLDVEPVCQRCNLLRGPDICLATCRPRFQAGKISERAP